MIYVVNYDLPRGIFGQSPKPFFDELQDSRSWSHYLEKTWLISTNESIGDLRDRLSRHLLENDKLLITEFTDKYTGFLPTDGWEWIKDCIEKGELYQ